MRYAGCANNQAHKEGDMTSRNTSTADMRALRAVVTVLARNHPQREDFRRQVIDLVTHQAAALPHREREEMLQAAKDLIDE